MSIQEVKVPQLSESVAEATLLEWKKKPGDSVKADEILIEIETDKVVLEVPAPASGVLTEILRTDGSTVASVELIARVDTEAKAVSMPAAVAMSSPAAVPAAAMPAAAMPAAAKLMAETGISLTSGTGRDGRITKGDVLAAAATPMAPATPAAAPLRPAPVAASPAVTSSALPPCDTSVWARGHAQRPSGAACSDESTASPGGRAICPVAIHQCHPHDL